MPHPSKALSSEFKICKGSDLEIKGAEFRICKGSDLEIRGAPSVQGPTLGVQDL